MTVVASISDRGTWGQKKANIVALTYSSNYTTDDTISSNAVGLSRIDAVFTTPSTAGGVLMSPTIAANGTNFQVVMQVTGTTTAAGTLATISGAYPAAVTNTVKVLVLGV